MSFVSLFLSVSAQTIIHRNIGLDSLHAIADRQTEFGVTKDSERMIYSEMTIRGLVSNYRFLFVVLLCRPFSLEFPLCRARDLWLWIRNTQTNKTNDDNNISNGNERNFFIFPRFMNIPMNHRHVIFILLLPEDPIAKWT